MKVVNAQACVLVKTHVVQAPLESLRARLEKRNADLPLYNFAVSSELIEQFSAMYEPPVANEGAELVLVDGGRHGSPETDSTSRHIAGNPVPGSHDNIRRDNSTVLR